MALSSTARATYLLVAAFLGGGLVGGATMMVVDQNNHDRRGETGQRLNYVDYLTTELDLTSEQRAAVEGILLQHEPRMDSLWGAVRNDPEVAAIRQAIRDGIRSQLTATQQER
ncbi:MAG: hypothetical protein SGI84_03180, partial [Gemmatimonadota bacterium]|nr:hypothetical protein [Gemmatimonadota bacterium]